MISYSVAKLPENTEKPHTKHVKNVEQGQVRVGTWNWLEYGDVVKTRTAVGGVDWELRVIPTNDGNQVRFLCELRGVATGKWKRWVSAKAYISRHPFCEDGPAVHAKLLGSEPLSGTIPLGCVWQMSVSHVNESRRNGRWVARSQFMVMIHATITVWEDTLEDKAEHDDVKLLVESRAISTNKAYLSYISTVLRTTLADHFKAGGSDEVSITNVGLETFLKFFKAIAPNREPITDENLETVYEMALRYDVGFLAEKCKKHLLATKGISEEEKVAIASKLQLTGVMERLNSRKRKHNSDEPTSYARSATSVFTKSELDDVTFTVEGRSIFANKQYISYMSSMLRGMLSDNFAGHSDEITIAQTSADDFVLFMQAVSPAQLEITDDNVAKLYELADYYGAQFLEKECENHLLQSQRISLHDKLLLAQTLNKMDFMDRLIENLSDEEVQSVTEGPNKAELTEEVTMKLLHHCENTW